MWPPTFGDTFKVMAWTNHLVTWYINWLNLYQLRGYDYPLGKQWDLPLAQVVFSTVHGLYQVHRFEWGESWERFVPKMVEIWRRIHEDLKVNSEDDSIFVFVFFLVGSFCFFYLRFTGSCDIPGVGNSKINITPSAGKGETPIPKWQEIWNKNNRFQVWKNQVPSKCSCLFQVSFAGFYQKQVWKSSTEMWNNHV